MSLDKLVDETTAALVDAIPEHEFTEEQRQAIQAVLEQSLIKTVKKTRKVNKEAIIACCGAEADMAHKLAEETRRATNSLISNLNALR